MIILNGVSIYTTKGIALVLDGLQAVVYKVN